ncbi:hypothetical protein IU453_00260 [Nocardia cyriacigeorgica]|uniref:hypothetical protein n=1 Tax=Nocardia cyriacigeorgica TaxID=135487 RepID=UPI001893567A|nr:hypothetical protein [Nocardia cyriacigeorgica]MBF6315224.1 hypothetical protein [Nocardia cyriacigeorgica]MBF6530010.1 hypothetical protein [Nocardia cyriacigeorgica]
MTNLTEGRAAQKGLVIAWSGEGDEKQYIVWKRFRSGPGGQLLLTDATWEQVTEFVDKWDPTDDFVHGD